METFTEIYARRNAYGFEGEFYIILQSIGKETIVKEFQFQIDVSPVESDLAYFHVQYKGYTEDFISCSAPRVFAPDEIDEVTMKDLKNLGGAKQALFYIFMISISKVMAVFSNSWNPQVFYLDPYTTDTTEPWFAFSIMAYVLPIPEKECSSVIKTFGFPDLENKFVRELRLL